MADNSFKENFWNIELGKFTGYEIVLKKVKDGQKSTKEYLEFLKLRVSAMEMYGKSLQKLGKIAASKHETGVMGAAWVNSQRATEELGSVLTKAVSSMDGEVSHAIELARKQREQRKREEDEMKQVQNALRAAMNKAQTRKRQYEVKVQEKKQAMTSLTTTEGEGKVCTKAQLRLQQATTQWELAANNLNQAEQQLEDARTTWELRTENSFEVFEALEEQRLNCVSNLQSSLLEVETGRLIAEETLVKLTTEFTEEDVTEELEKFVEKSRTDEQPPPCVKFTINDDDCDDFDSDEDEGDSKLYDSIPTNISAPVSKIQAIVENKVDMASIQRKIFSLLPTKKKETKISKCDSTRSSHSSRSSQPTVNDTEEELVSNAFYVSALETTAREGVTYDFQNPEPEVIDEEESMSVGSYKGAGTMMRVTYSYEAKHTSDISLSEGQLATLVQIVDGEWAEVKTSGELRGYFPRAYLEPADS